MLKTSRAIQPYSDAQNMASFSALRHIFRCDEGSGSTLTCAKSGLVWTPYELSWDSTLKAAIVNPTHATFANYGNASKGFSSFGSSYILHVSVLRLVTAADFRCSIGDTAGNNIGTSGVGSIHFDVAGSGGNVGWVGVTPAMPVAQEGKDIVVVSKFTPWNGSQSTSYVEILDKDGLTLSTSGTYVNTSIDPAPITPDPKARWSGGKFYTAQWYAFADGFPSDLSTGISWIGASAIAGHRDPYPGWVNLI